MIDYLPQKQTLWLLFDLDNGHKESHRYVWWFDTHREAIEFRSQHIKKRHHAALSQPIKATLEG